MKTNPQLFLLYWGRGYGDHEFSSSVLTLDQIRNSNRFDNDLIAWCKDADYHDGTWGFSGPVDEFYIKRVL